DYIHVCDVAEAHVRALQYEGSLPLDVFNIGTGKGTSVLEMVRSFMDVTGINLSYKLGGRRPGDITEIFANVEKSKRELGWTAQRTVEDALRDAWNWEQQLKHHD
ncbi:MAG: UDP-glucose 4-epimerase GalE, partial [Bacteroidota bacterium]